MKRFIVRPSKAEDAEAMIECARHEDALEWDASCTGGLKDNLAWSIAWCNNVGEAITVHDTQTGRPVLIGGAQPQASNIRRVLTWMVVAEGADTGWGLVLMKDYRDDLMGFFKRWPRTECFSDVRNVLHHRWLTYLGYDEVDRVPWGPHGKMFIQFKRGF